MKTGVLIINLGTPDSPEPQAVGRYLREFLMDKWVVDVPKIFRWILVNLLIVPKRKFNSAEAYEKVWSEKGSPLFHYSVDFCIKLQKVLGERYSVELAMRYGNPSIQSALEEFQKAGLEKVIVFPMYPQYAESSTRSSLEEVARSLRSLNFQPELKIVPPFYKSDWFIRSFAKLIKEKLKAGTHLLLTYHGLPERHIRKTDATKEHCLKNENCCDSINEANLFCYRAHCFATSRELAKQLGIKKEQYSVSFQSRLGRSPWIKPYTDFHYKDLIKEGNTRLLVASPSFVTDCLETIEELGMRLRKDFYQHGGVEFELVSSLNDSDHWVEAVSQVVDRVAKS